ncbi:MAG: DUF1553 domain-containing protein [Verrucomicrobia bacterium]|nr:DUF1553 domain-containing protein [Verrucomicrobiota bacterium]
MYRVRHIGLLLVWMLDLSCRADSLQLYLEQIKPVFKERCYACHGALKQKGGLRLDSVTLMERGSNNGNILDVESKDLPTLFQRLISTDPEERMPPEGKPIETETIQALRMWIEAGHPGPSDEKPEDDPLSHWAFLPPDKPELNHPARNPIDAILAQHHEENNLNPQAAAEPRLLMRRLFLDLVGLPPEPEQIEDFLNAPEAPGYSRIVDQLLASPHHAERWGRHWMDVWRYSDWFGLGTQLRYSQKHIWHWRDWILESLNEDKGYDQMILEMLAADELYPTDQNRLRATGFLARNYFLFNRTTWLDKTIEHTSKAFLGLTMQCSKCHDHKYDPISARDYYQFRAILEPHQIRTDALPGESDLNKNGLPRVFDMHPEAPTYVHVRGNEKQRDISEKMHPAPPAFLRHVPFNITPIILPPTAYRPEIQTHVKDTLLKEAQTHIDVLEAGLKKDSSDGDAYHSNSKTGDTQEHEWMAAKLRPAMITAKFEAIRNKAMVPDSLQQQALDEKAAKTEYKYELARFDWKISKARQAVEAGNDGKEALKQTLDQIQEKRTQHIQSHLENPLQYTPLRASIKALESPAETEKERFLPYPKTSTGRRTALAMWITHPDHPLTARVAVNHIWMRHFGAPLVDPVTDFGRQTNPPKLQELLDFLAITLIENDWKMKPIHRLIVTSQAYKRSSSESNALADNLIVDPHNELVWRQNSIRMESQILRDSILQLSNQLHTQMGGPTIDPEGNPNMHRRSLYFKHSRDDQHRFLTLFDDASILACYRRSESVIPQQALALANSSLSMDASTRITEALTLKTGIAEDSHAAFVKLAFETILGWKPTPEEMNACLDSITNWQQENESNSNPNTQSPRASLIHVLLNHNDFATIR